MNPSVMEGCAAHGLLPLPKPILDCVSLMETMDYMYSVSRVALLQPERGIIQLTAQLRGPERPGGVSFNGRYLP